MANVAQCHPALPSAGTGNTTLPILKGATGPQHPELWDITCLSPGHQAARRLCAPLQITVPKSGKKNLGYDRRWLWPATSTALATAIRYTSDGAGDPRVIDALAQFAQMGHISVAKLLILSPLRAAQIGRQSIAKPSDTTLPATSWTTKPRRHCATAPSTCKKATCATT